MYSTTADRLAAGLRALADAVASAGTTQVHGSIYLRPELCDAEADQVADVDRLAAALGMVAETTRDGLSWYHQAKHDLLDGALMVHVRASVQAPPQLCGCGAACGHGAAVAV